MGAFNAAFYIYFFSGILNLIVLFAVLGGKKFRDYFKSLPFSYFLGPGLFFILNNIFLYAAIGLTRNDEELIIVTLLNYLWPVLIFVFRVPIFRVKIIPGFFFSAIAMATAGIAVAFLQGYSAEKLFAIVSAMDDNFLAFLFALSGAASWAIYSNLISKYKSREDIVAIPVVFIISGLVFFCIQLLKGENSILNLVPIYNNPYLYLTILGPTCLGYLFWFLGMKYGNRDLITGLAYMIPLGSVMLLSQIHSIPIHPLFWVSTILIIAGAVLGIKAVPEIEN